MAIEEHTTAGDASLRDYIQQNWTHVSIVDDTGSEVTRIEIAADSRVQWTNTPSNNPITLEVVLTGGDADITDQLPVTIERTELYNTSGGGDALSGSTADPATLAVGQDEMTIKHDVYQPIP